MMNLKEATHYIEKRQNEVSSESFFAFVKKTKLALSCPLIHVAGSNGKGRTCFYLALLASKKYGSRCGTLFNSFAGEANDAIWIGDQPLKEEEFLKKFEEHLPLYEKYNLTGYEILVDIAHRVFEEKELALAIVECGMGALGDPSLLDDLKTELAIITNVSLEHTEFLGTTLSEIALACSGVIAKKKPVLVGPIDEGCEEALRSVCAKKKTSLSRLDRPHLPHLVGGTEFVFDYPPYKNIAIATTAFYEVGDAILALEANKICPLLGLTEEEIREAWKGKNHPLHCERKGDFVFDVAENPAAIEMLCRSFPTLGRGKPVHVLFAAKDTANISVMLPLLDDNAKTVVLTSFEGEGARDEMSFALYTEDHEYIENPLMALMNLSMRFPGETILITGNRVFVTSLWRTL